MECEYSVYNPKTKQIENHTHIATIPLLDFYNRRLRNMKSCVVSFRTRETSLIIDNYNIVKYCSWEEGLDYFKNKRKNTFINILKERKTTIIHTILILLLLIGIVTTGIYINDKYEPLDKTKTYMNNVKISIINFITELLMYLLFAILIIAILIIFILALFYALFVVFYRLIMLILILIISAFILFMLPVII